MKNINKITMISVGMLLASVLIATVVLSGTIAKFTSVGSSNDTARVAKWGLEITAGSNAAATYGTIEETDSEGNVTSFGIATASDGKNIIVPGTKGYLTWMRIQGSPEAAYEIDVEGAFRIGAGYTDDNRLIRGGDGLPVEYFPIIIRLYTIDQRNGDAKTELGTFSYSDDVTLLSTNITNAIKQNFDTTTQQAPGSIDKLYIVEWEWLFTPENPYQSDALDTALAEAIKDNKNTKLFEIGLDMSVKISQSQ